MKKFEFSLSKLMEVKDQQLSQEKEKLGEYRRKLSEIEKELAENIQKQKDTNDFYVTQMARGGLTVPQIQTAKNYIERLKDEAEELLQDIEDAKQDVEMQVQLVVSITKDIKIMEKLKDKKQSEYNKLLQKDQEQFIEEFVNTSKQMKRVNEE